MKDEGNQFHPSSFILHPFPATGTDGILNASSTNGRTVACGQAAFAVLL
jgi:hypothetical protein